MGSNTLIGPLSYPAINTTFWDHGSYQSVSLAGRFILVADVVNAAGESRYSALRIPGAAGGYQVTTGKTLYVTKARFSMLSAPAAFLLFAATADAGDSQIAAPAGIVSHNSRADGVPSSLVGPVSSTMYESDLYASFAATQYLGVRNMTASSTLYLLLVCHEE